MREKILAGIRDVNSWTFTAIAILFAVTLTTGLNSLFVWLDGGRYNPKVFMYATIDAIVIPLIIAPIMINAFKRVISLEHANQQLEGQIEQHQHAQQAAEQRVANLQAISDFAIECTAAAPDADLHKLIADKLHVITGAMGVSISEYDAKEQALITRYLAVSGQILSTLNNLLGRNIIGLHSPTSPEMIQQITSEIVAVASDLSEVSFGAIPKSVSAIVQKTFGIGSFTGLAFIYGGELWGTAIVVMKKDQPPIDRDLAMALTNVAAMAMRRKKTEEALYASEARYRALVEMSPDAIILSDLSGNIGYCNQQTAVVHGCEYWIFLPWKNIPKYYRKSKLLQ
jgi:PAS domain-containing protein